MSRWSDLVHTLSLIFWTLFRHAARFARKATFVLGVLFGLLIILAFTSIPFHAHRWLGQQGGECAGNIDAIAVLGGSGMPSGPELLRLRYASALAQDFPDARVVIVHAEDTVTAELMVDELMLGGVGKARISLQLKGSNTREQALGLATDRSILKGERIALVTAPENMYRTLGSYRKVGFGKVCGVPAFDQALFVDLDYDFRKVGGRMVAPDVSGSMDLRYTFWNYLKLEVTCLREFAAIAYYRVNGWL